MWKINLILLAILLTFYFIAEPKSKTYWENVGPAWDKMLNPKKYGE